MSLGSWSAIAAAARRDAGARVPFVIDGIAVGSVARTNLIALRRWPAALRLDDGGVTLTVPAGERDAALAEIHAELRREGLILAWRDESYLVVDPASQRPLARIERAASRFWGTLTFGAHCTGYVADGNRRPQGLWIAQRSFTKHTDPGMFDNLVGGGVPAGESPFETLLREGWEEAGQAPDVMRRARPGRVIRLHRDIPEGLQHEWLYSFDLALTADEQPANQDGEVHAFRCLPVDEALALAAGESMTVDAALVTLDFALRHRLVGDAAAAESLAARAAGLWVNIAR